MIWDWDYAFRILPRLLEGLVITLEATAMAGALALGAGLVIAIARRARSPVIRVPVYWAVEFIRRTPLLIQLYFLFYVLPDIGIVISPLTAGVIGLGLHNSAYMSEVYRAGINSVPAGQWEAAKALNYPRIEVWRRVILPQAVPPMIPALGNYLLILFKETALLATISVVDMMGTARIVGNESYRYFEPMTMVGLLYLAIAVPSAIGLRALEQRMTGRTGAI
jgi:polar amino acid transport system permease protein